jgi:hypothetical protein
MFLHIAQIEQWIKLTSRDSATISATRAIFQDSIIKSTEHTDWHVIIRLPITLTATEKGTFINTGFNILKQDIDPIREDFELYLLVSLNDELKFLFPLNLATDLVCNRFTDEEVFDEIIHHFC